MSEKRVFEWSSETATVSWDRDLCIHVGECTRAKGDLFEMGRKPWCRPEGVEDERVREVVERCPSGALAARFTDASKDETAPAENTVTVTDRGPLYFHGALEIDGAPDRAPGLAYRAALCRCGKSRNKPFCDNSHLQSGFDDHGAVGESGTALESAGGPLKVEFKKDGPIRVSGNLTIRAASGRVAWQGTATALCRCGLSSNKPFCDGSHRKEGWTDGR